MILFKKILYKLSKFFGRISLGTIKWGSLFWSLFFIFVIIGLSTNIYTAFTKGVDTINNFKLEQVKLDELRKENQQLQDQVKEYESVEYKKIYARENLNLAGKDETLYYVDRPKPTPQIEGLPEPVIKVTLDDNFSVWKKLILGL